MDAQSVENLVGRMGGDEFVVLLSSPDDISRSNAIAAEIVDAVASPYYIDGKTCVIGACVGVALWSDDTGSVSELLANADLAMYEAKKAGKNTWRQFTGGSSQNMFQRSA